MKSWSDLILSSYKTYQKLVTRAAGERWRRNHSLFCNLYLVIFCNTVDIYFDWPHSVWLCIFLAGCWVLFWGPLFLPPLQRVPVSSVGPCPVCSSALAACLGISSQKLASDVHVKNSFNQCSLMSGYNFFFLNNKLYQSTKYAIILPTMHLIKTRKPYLIICSFVDFL